MTAKQEPLFPEPLSVPSAESSQVRAGSKPAPSPSPNPEIPKYNPNDLSFHDMLQQLDEATEILEASRTLLQMINGRPGKTAATATELAAALNTQIVVQVVASQLDYLRDPDNYFEEENNHAQ